MHVSFDPLQIDWTFFTAPTSTLSDQNGGGGSSGMMLGGSAAGYPIFTGLAYQRGAGIGSVFRSLFRFLLPIGRQAGVAIGRQGLESGSRVLSGLLDGKPLKETVVNEGRSGLKNLLDKAADNLGKQKGSGGSFDFKRYKKTLLKDRVDDAESATDKHIKRRLHSSIGPAFHHSSSSSSFPITSSTDPSRKRGGKKKTTSSARTQKRLRIDALGPY